MATVTGLARITITRADGSVVNIAQAQDFTSVFAESKDFALSTEDFYTFLDLMTLKIKDRVGATGLALVIKGRNRLEDALLTLGTFPLDGNDQPVPLGSLPSKVYHRFRIEDNRLVKRWLLYGLSVHGEPDGGYH